MSMRNILAPNRSTSRVRPACLRWPNISTTAHSQPSSTGADGATGSSTNFQPSAIGVPSGKGLVSILISASVVIRFFLFLARPQRPRRQLVGARHTLLEIPRFPRIYILDTLVKRWVFRQRMLLHTPALKHLERPQLEPSPIET